MNLVCAYCGFPFARDHIAAERHELAGCGRIRLAMLGVALAVPVVGLVAGFSAMHRPDPRHRAASRQWLIAALCGSLLYIALVMRYLVL